jgi:HD-GYP domain-containing protein (c-di-GMP phosphodiesterase class II)
MPPEDALREFMAMSGTVLDPDIVENFLEVVKELQLKAGDTSMNTTGGNV